MDFGCSFYPFRTDFSWAPGYFNPISRIDLYFTQGSGELVGAQPPPYSLISRHLPRKVVISCSFAHHSPVNQCFTSPLGILFKAAKIHPKLNWDPSFLSHKIRGHCILPYIWLMLMFMVNVCKDTIHWSYGFWKEKIFTAMAELLQKMP